MKVTNTDSTVTLTLTKSDTMDLFSLLLELRMTHRQFGPGSPSSAVELLTALIYDLQQTLRELEN
jgi:hypothetical protein